MRGVNPAINPSFFFAEERQPGEITYDETLTSTDIFNLNQIDMQLFGLILIGFANLIFIQSTLQGRELIFRKHFKFNTPEPHPVSTALIGTKITTVAVILFLYVSLTRLNQLEEAKRKGTINFSLEPNYLLTFLTFFNLIISFLSVSGTSVLAKREENQAFFF